MSHIIIDENRCKSCYICVETCPKKLIRKSKKVSNLGNNLVEFVDNNNECIGCAMCATRCPDMAIVEVHR